MMNFKAFAFLMRSVSCGLQSLLCCLAYQLHGLRAAAALFAVLMVIYCCDRLYDAAKREAK